MLTINVICIGKVKEKFFRDAIDEYSKRLSKYCKLNILELPDEKIPDKTNLNIENEIQTNNIRIFFYMINDIIAFFCFNFIFNI